ncbi:hypothetical protein PSECIP111854_04121 [Pseudoalteromonas sp. CIP111854]|uniref:Uncharacterized protein n=1 Tax=Pseudoalteromonas holothuriae TaxID=2963714 RepID=A0A9W4R5C0_9GAMM|nr:IS66 family insertion sequence element accessory protein TnpB [Pseudoalteromonas sp. CIP111854]CAH9067499.1 hypothetical protein PSECIP111854_04121 [Pseudoalteromonas sp. CIP111854]
MIIWNIDSVLLYRQPVDFRKSINGLAAIVEQDAHSHDFDHRFSSALIT